MQTHEKHQADEGVSTMHWKGVDVEVSVGCSTQGFSGGGGHADVELVEG